MNLQRCRTALVLLLSAGILFGSMTPPAVRHAHVDGDRDHDHRSESRESHSHGHRQGHAHSHGQSHDHSVQAEQVATGDGRLHLHACLFGIVFLLPDEDVGTTPFQNDRDCFDSPSLVKWLDSRATVYPVTKIEFLSHNLLLQVHFDAESQPDSRRIEFAQTTHSSLLLCDAARSERSGVQQV